MAEHQNLGDQDAGKGAVEGDGRASTERGQSGNTSLAGQNPHRTESNFIKSNDTDFPEPGLNPEHSGQNVPPHGERPLAKGIGGEQHSSEDANVKVGRSPERDQVDQDPGERQKENQNQQKDDSLAA